MASEDRESFGMDGWSTVPSTVERFKGVDVKATLGSVGPEDI